MTVREQINEHIKNLPQVTPQVELNPRLPNPLLTKKDYPPTMTHDQLVAALTKPGEDICNHLTPLDAHLIHMTVGISGEAGELLDAIKKTVVYCKPLDRENVIEELGDLEFYMEGLRASLGISRQQTIDHNIAKLTKRYGEKYSNQAAITRADKQ